MKKILSVTVAVMTVLAAPSAVLAHEVTYQGTVVKIVDFGAFVNFFGSRDGLVHVSQLAPQRVANVKDVVKEGDKVWVKFLGADERGKVRLSMKAIDQETGAELKEDA